MRALGSAAVRASTGWQNSGGDLGSSDQQHRLTYRGQRCGVRVQPPLAKHLGEDRRTVALQQPADLGRERRPRALARHLGDQRLSHFVHAVAGGHVEEALGQPVDPFRDCRRELARRVTSSSTSPRTRSGWRSARSVATVAP